jgi:hypothetical protein
MARANHGMKFVYRQACDFAAILIRHERATRSGEFNIVLSTATPPTVGGNQRMNIGGDVYLRSRPGQAVDFVVSMPVEVSIGRLSQSWQTT